MRKLLIIIYIYIVTMYLQYNIINITQYDNK